MHAQQMKKSARLYWLTILLILNAPRCPVGSLHLSQRREEV
jgi:hypothetical protein